MPSESAGDGASPNDVGRRDGEPAVPLSAYRELLRRHRVELQLVENLSHDGGIVGAARILGEALGKALWVIDDNFRVVAKSFPSTTPEPSTPSVRKLLDLARAQLLEESRPADPGCLVISPTPDGTIRRRHLMSPVRHGTQTFAWLVVAEVPGAFHAQERELVARGALHMGFEYGVQRRVAKASSNARTALARALLSGSAPDEDLITAGEYLGVDVSLDRVVVHIPDADGSHRDHIELAEELGHSLGVEVLATRGTTGTTLLVEAASGEEPVVVVDRISRALARLFARMGETEAAAGVSGVTPPAALRRAHREAWEVALCIGRFASRSNHVITVDDLGPARLFVANSDVVAVRRYVRDLLGGLLEEPSGRAPLLATLQEFFDSGRNVTRTAHRLRVHANTVRQRLSRIHALTGLDVANSSNDQLSAQGALLVLRLSGHPQLPRAGV